MPPTGRRSIRPVEGATLQNKLRTHTHTQKVHPARRNPWTVALPSSGRLRWLSYAGEGESLEAAPVWTGPDWRCFQLGPVWSGAASSPNLSGLKTTPGQTISDLRQGQSEPVRTGSNAKPHVSVLEATPLRSGPNRCSLETLFPVQGNRSWRTENGNTSVRGS